MSLFKSHRLIELDRRSPYHFAISGKSFQIVRDEHPELLRRVRTNHFPWNFSLKQQSLFRFSYAYEAQFLLECYPNKSNN